MTLSLRHSQPMVSSICIYTDRTDLSKEQLREEAHHAMETFVLLSSTCSRDHSSKRDYRGQTRCSKTYGDLKELHDNTWTENVISQVRPGYIPQYD